jgi:hypothetical protein
MKFLSYLDTIFSWKFQNFFIHEIKSYSRTNIENVTDGTEIFKILRHIILIVFGIEEVGWIEQDWI